MNLGSDPGEKLSVPNTALDTGFRYFVWHWGASASAGVLFRRFQREQFRRLKPFLFRKVARAALETVCYKPATMKLLENGML